MDMEKAEELTDDTVYFSMNDMTKMQENQPHRPQNKNPKGLNFEGITNDEDVIDYFLENNTDWVICEYFQKGDCKYGD